MCQIRVNLRRWACLLAALACLLALLPLPAHAAGAASKVVRVGWYEDAYNITGKNGERSGYAYEYEQSVAAYTGWTDDEKRRDRPDGWCFLHRGPCTGHAVQ